MIGDDDALAVGREDRAGRVMPIGAAVVGVTLGAAEKTTPAVAMVKVSVVSLARKPTGGSLGTSG